MITKHRRAAWLLTVLMGLLLALPVAAQEASPVVQTPTAPASTVDTPGVTESPEAAPNQPAPIFTGEAIIPGIFTINGTEDSPVYVLSSGTITLSVTNTNWLFAVSSGTTCASITEVLGASGTNNVPQPASSFVSSAGGNTFSLFALDPNGIDTSSCRVVNVVATIPSPTNVVTPTPTATPSVAFTINGTEDPTVYVLSTGTITFAHVPTGWDFELFSNTACSGSSYFLPFGLYNNVPIPASDVVGWVGGNTFSAGAFERDGSGVSWCRIVHVVDVFPTPTNTPTATPTATPLVMLTVNGTVNSPVEVVSTGTITLTINNPNWDFVVSSGTTCMNQVQSVPALMVNNLPQPVSSFVGWAGGNAFSIYATDPNGIERTTCRVVNVTQPTPTATPTQTLVPSATWTPTQTLTPTVTTTPTEVPTNAPTPTATPPVTFTINDVAGLPIVVAPTDTLTLSLSNPNWYFAVSSDMTCTNTSQVFPTTGINNVPVPVSTFVNWAGGDTFSVYAYDPTGIGTTACLVVYVQVNNPTPITSTPIVTPSPTPNPPVIFTVNGSQDSPVSVSSTGTITFAVSGANWNVALSRSTTCAEVIQTVPSDRPIPVSDLTVRVGITFSLYAFDIYGIGRSSCRVVNVIDTPPTPTVPAGEVLSGVFFINGVEDSIVSLKPGDTITLHVAQPGWYYAISSDTTCTSITTQVPTEQFSDNGWTASMFAELAGSRSFSIYAYDPNGNSTTSCRTVHVIDALLTPTVATARTSTNVVVSGLPDTGQGSGSHDGASVPLYGLLLGFAASITIIGLAVGKRRRIHG